MSDAPAVECGMECAGCTAECAACATMACGSCDGCNHGRATLGLRAWVAELALLTATGGDPAEFKMPEDLAEYWLYGEGAAKVRWCTDGSFDRARRLLLKEGVPPHMVDGAVANLYFRACGKHPGRHND